MKKSPFPSSKWAKSSRLRKMYVAELGEGTVGLFSYIIIYLYLRESRWNPINTAMFSCVQSGCLLFVRRFWEVIIPNHFDDRLCSGFSERPKQHFRCWATRSLCWLVQLWRPMVKVRNLFGKFVSIRVYGHVFSSDKKKKIMET